MSKKKLPSKKSKSKIYKWATKMAQNQEQVDRDLSLLEFNKRVLEQACDPTVPLLERLRFLSIFHNNMNEFFMKRMWISRYLFLNHPGSETQKKMQNIKPFVQSLFDRAGQELENLKVQLGKEGIHILNWKDLTNKEKEKMTKVFLDNIFPVLTPLSVDQSHPFPHISTLSNSLAIALRYPNSSEKVFSRLKIPTFFPRFYRCSSTPTGESRWVSLIDIITGNLAKFYPQMEIEAVMPFRIIRNIEIEMDQDGKEYESLLTMISQNVKDRRFGEVVKLEYLPPENKWLLNLLMDELDIYDCDVYPMSAILDFTSLDEIYKINRKELKFERWPQVTALELSQDHNIFDCISQKDILLHHPFEDFSTSVEDFILAAVNDPNVLAIKMTLYRTNQEGSIIKALIRAAESGKQVVCLVELQARMDEENNITWANELENAGCHVVYGIVGLKTHCKVAFAVRKEGTKIRSYAHLGTGNYNSQTAKFYTDMGLLTARKDVTEDVIDLFNYITGRSLKSDYKKLIVAPMQLKSFFLKAIEQEAKNAKDGKPSRIIIKCNNLEDHDVVEALYKASQVGVKIDLIIRSICTIRPGVAVLSENIKVCSIVDRMLEHSRLFYFQSGKEDPVEGKMYIGSADLMYRNLTNRVELLTPIEDLEAKHEYYDVLKVYLDRDIQTWEMNTDGSYTRSTEKSIPSQRALFNYYKSQNTLKRGDQ
ncbi:MAG: polyphosphate kinase 1 [Bdellovibrionales bacterium]|nr:polyphosphate kinase 1 [Bdellovibrionales bacterium]